MKWNTGDGRTLHGRCSRCHAPRPVRSPPRSTAGAVAATLHGRYGRCHAPRPVRSLPRSTAGAVAATLHSRCSHYVALTELLFSSPAPASGFNVGSPVITAVVVAVTLVTTSLVCMIAACLIVKKSSLRTRREQKVCIALTIPGNVPSDLDQLLLWVGLYRFLHFPFSHRCRCGLIRQRDLKT